MLTGLKKMQETTSATMNISRENRINRLFMDDGEMAQFRFLTEPDEVVSALIHEINVMTPKGLKWRSHYCTAEDLGTCKHCQSGNVPRKKIFMWTYVYTIFRKKQNPRLVDDKDAETWPVVKVGGQSYYKEDVNGIRLFQASPGKDFIFQNALISFAEEYGSLTDRDYKWIRQGKGISTVYNLTPKDPTEMSAEIKTLREGLPDLSKVVSGKIVSMDGKEASSEGTASAPVASEEDGDGAVEEETASAELKKKVKAVASKSKGMTKEENELF